MANFVEQGNAAFSDLWDFQRTTEAYYHDQNGILQLAGAGVPRIGGEGLLMEAGSGNALLWVRDLSNAVWIKDALISQDQVGIDGVANTAWTLEDNSTSSALPIRQQINVSDDSLINSFSVYFKKTTGAATIPAMQVFYANGTSKISRYAVDTNDGTLLLMDGSTPADSTAVESYGDFWRVTLSVANNSSGNTIVNLYVYPAITVPGDDTNDVTLTGTCVIDWPQIETNKRESTTPMLSEGSTGGRVADDCQSKNVSWLNSDEFTIAGAIDSPYDNFISPRYISLDDGTTTNRLQFYQPSAFPSGWRAFLTSATISETLDFITTDQPIKFAVTYSKSKLKFTASLNGEFASVDLTTADFVATTLRLNEGIVSPRALKANYQNIKVLPYAASESELISLTS